MNIMIISVISMITFFSIINTNYAFADNKDTQVKTEETSDEQNRKSFVVEELLRWSDTRIFGF